MSEAERMRARSASIPQATESAYEHHSAAQQGTYTSYPDRHHHATGERGGDRMAIRSPLRVRH